MLRIVRPMILTALTGALASGCGTDRSTPRSANVPMAPAVRSVMNIPNFQPNPGDFAAQIDNPHLAFERGKVFRYEGQTEDGLETIVVEVTNNTKIILGVATTVVHDQVYLNGELIEDTFDWYAQDNLGNVWYFGEDSKQIENGVVVGSEGSWEAGVDGAKPGIIMLAEPKIGTKYQQEFAPGVAEDMAKVLSLSETVEVPYGRLEGCLKTVEWTPLEPGAREFKYYAPGIGQVLEVQSRGGGVRVELITIEN